MGTPQTEGVLLDETLAQYALRHLKLACTHWSSSRDTQGFMDLAESELAAAYEARVKGAIKQFESELSTATDRLAALEADARRKDKLLSELADDLEIELQNRYGPGEPHPAMKGRYERDMAIVVEARAALYQEPAEGG